MVVGAGPSGNNDEEAGADEAFLAQHKIASDGDALLGFFRKRTLSSDSRRRLEDLVKKLGDPAFQTREEAERELMAFGSAALPLVKGALEDPDLEIARRAPPLRGCLRKWPRLDAARHGGARPRPQTTRRQHRRAARLSSLRR